jgi:hypothetical protein
MTQYTFVTMSAPIHAALALGLAARQDWRRFGIICAAYVLSGAAFFALNPGALRHATVVASGQPRVLQFGDALNGMPQMLVPWPSFLPMWVTWLAGTCVLAGAIGLAAYLCLERRAASEAAPIRVVLAGMLGAGVLQFGMVATGFFPGWATGPNHMCAFWLLTVFAIAVSLNRHPMRWLRGTTAVAMVAMLGLQLLFAWHCHRILPHVNASYIATLEPDLVCLDNLARGMVLQLTDVMSPEQLVLATTPQRLGERLASKELQAYARILYLPMDETAGNAKRDTIALVVASGWRTRELPVVHPGMYDALLFER